MRRTRRRWAISLTAMATVMAVAWHAAWSRQAASTASSPARVFVGYVFAKTNDIDFRLYTHLCHAFLTADGEGRIKKDAKVPSVTLTSEAHEAGVAVLVSLGGWGYDKQFAAIVSKPEAEDRYVEAVLDIVDTFNYDGVDLDWEYPDTKEEVAGFERLTRRFRKALNELGRRKGRHMVIIMAASANPGTLKWLDKTFLLETMDWINVMTYDYTGDWTEHGGHHSPLYASPKQPGSPRSTELTMRYLLEQKGLPADRLTVGIPLYGRGFSIAEPYASTRDATRKKPPRGEYANLQKLENDPAWARVWDDQTKNPWLISRTEPMVIGYDDAQSVAIKVDWAMKRGFRGVFFWQVHGDRLPDRSNPLQQAAHREWEKVAGKRP